MLIIDSGRSRINMDNGNIPAPSADIETALILKLKASVMYDRMI